MNAVADGPLASRARRIGPVSRYFCRLAGGDPGNLVECPLADRVSYTIFGFLIAAAFVWISLTVGLALSVAFGGTTLADLICGAAGMLVASVAVSLDRLFIVADTITQGELAIGYATARPVWSWARRVGVAVVRIALALGIATLTADLFSLWLDASAVEQVLVRNHYAENAEVYNAIDAQTKLIDAEIDTRRKVMEGVDTQVSGLAETLASLRNGNDAAQQDSEIVSLTTYLGELRGAEATLVREVALHDDTMTCERLGERCREGDSGQRGQGPRYELAEARHDNAASRLRDVRSQIESTTDRLTARNAEIANDAGSNDRQRSARIEEANTALVSATARYGRAVEAYKQAVEGREGRIAAFTKFQVSQPGFVPLTMGLTERWAALYQMHAASPASAEITAKLKIGIVTVELMAIIAKLLASPKTEYAMQAYAAYYLRRIELRAKVQEVATRAERGRQVHESELRQKEQTRRAREAADRTFDDLFGDQRASSKTKGEYDETQPS